jgi:hypothetical protein
VARGARANYHRVLERINRVLVYLQRLGLLSQREENTKTQISQQHREVIDAIQTRRYHFRIMFCVFGLGN